MRGPEPGKILVWDIETSDFKANFGHMLMWAAKFVGEEPVFRGRIDQTPGYGKTPLSMINDREIVESIRDLVDSAGAIVHHYGDRFDLRFLNTRCLEWGLLPPGKPTTIDTWKVAKFNLAMTSNRLGTLAESFGGDHQKGGLSKEQWKLAVHGDRDVLDAMMQYCIDDVLATEAVYLKMRPLIWNHPITHVKYGDLVCPTCGSGNTTGNGTRRTKHYLVHRQRCRECGASFERKREKMT
jgi:hypothetical protein